MTEVPGDCFGDSLRQIHLRLPAGKSGQTGCVDELTVDFPGRDSVAQILGFYGAGDLVGFGDFVEVGRALAAFVARPAVVRGLAIPH